MQVPKGTLLWEACKAEGIDIPIFCYHTKLGPVGACRTCLVEVAGQTEGPMTACSTPVADGMVVRTRSPIVEKAQRGILEFLLLNHPLDCPICDRGGECPLQDQTFSYGPGTSRYIEPKRHHVKPIALGPTIALDRERCVLCWRCVRFCAEVAEDKSIVLLDRGRFNFEFINSPERLRSPLIRRGDAFEETSWSEALAFIADRLRSIVAEDGPAAVAGVASPRLTNEDLFVFKRFMRDVVGSSV